jgi:hypothetical protein
MGSGWRIRTGMLLYPSDETIAAVPTEIATDVRYWIGQR